MKDVKKPHYISTLHYICVFVHLATVCADFYGVFFNFLLLQSDISFEFKVIFRPIAKLVYAFTE